MDTKEEQGNKRLKSDSQNKRNLLCLTMQKSRGKPRPFSWICISVFVWDGGKANVAVALICGMCEQFHLYFFCYLNYPKVCFVLLNMFLHADLLFLSSAALRLGFVRLLPDQRGVSSSSYFLLLVWEREAARAAGFMTFFIFSVCRNMYDNLFYYLNCAEPDVCRIHGGVLFCFPIVRNKWRLPPKGPWLGLISAHTTLRIKATGYTNPDHLAQEN